MRIVQTCLTTERYDGPLRLAAGCVDCWVVSLASFPADAEVRALTLLSEDERRRAARFYFERQRQRYVLTHAVLRLLLARYLMKAPDSIVIAADIYGRPMLAAPDGDLEFSLSRSSDAALVGVSLRSPLGVDIELVRAVPDFLAIAERYFAPNEIDNLLRSAPGQGCGDFFVTWTRKEAFVKGLGVGLSFPLDAVCTGAQHRAPHLAVRGMLCSDWTIADLAALEGYKAAVAVRRRNVAFRCREVSWSLLLQWAQDADSNCRSG